MLPGCDKDTTTATQPSVCVAISGTYIVCCGGGVLAGCFLHGFSTDSLALLHCGDFSLLGCLLWIECYR